ncbi:hypothetical protein [Streptomyces sp. NRRL S-118]|uniref:hypothetical protein n=1 Tax=Streptomyces sp. NRRL S-118 TaxID=1463881 RepID=UPI00131A65A6|nr:hypothetical protein [Streptomyces sp. NRRL S-118]
MRTEDQDHAAVIDASARAEAAVEDVRHRFHAAPLGAKSAGLHPPGERLDGDGLRLGRVGDPAVLGQQRLADPLLRDPLLRSQWRERRAVRPARPNVRAGEAVQSRLRCMPVTGHQPTFQKKFCKITSVECLGRSTLPSWSAKSRNAYSIPSGMQQP